MPSDEVILLKQNIRKEILQKLRAQEAPIIKEKSRIICEKVVSSEHFISAGTIMSYCSLAYEVDTDNLNRKILETGKKLVVPFIDKENGNIIASAIGSIDDLVKGPYGIPVPMKGPVRVSLEEIDLIVVPAIAYDRTNMRLGRGKGYYDKFLSQAGLSSSKPIGVAFRFQVMDTIPSDPHDRPVSMVFTD